MLLLIDNNEQKVDINNRALAQGVIQQPFKDHNEDKLFDLHQGCVAVEYHPLIRTFLTTQ